MQRSVLGSSFVSVTVLLLGFVFLSGGLSRERNAVKGMDFVFTPPECDHCVRDIQGEACEMIAVVTPTGGQDGDCPSDICDGRDCCWKGYVTVSNPALQPVTIEWRAPGLAPTAPGLITATSSASTVQWSFLTGSCTGDEFDPKKILRVSCGTSDTAGVIRVTVGGSSPCDIRMVCRDCDGEE